MVVVKEIRASREHDAGHGDHGGAASGAPATNGR